MKKRPSVPAADPGLTDRSMDTEKIWCPHLECFKYLTVCRKCRIMIKCQSYQDYWSPRLDF